MKVTLNTSLLRWPLFSKPERVQVLMALVLLADHSGRVVGAARRLQEYTRLSSITVTRSLEDLSRFGVISMSSERVTILLLPDGMALGDSVVEHSSGVAGGAVTPSISPSSSAGDAVTPSISPSSSAGGAVTPSPATPMPSRFRRPALQDVSDVITARGYHFTADEFIDYYDSVGWVVGRTRKPMKDWKAACRTFERNASKTTKKQSYEQVRDSSRAIYLAAEASPALGGCGAALAAISDDGACQGLIEALPG